MGLLNYESPSGPKILRGVNRQWQQVADSMGASFRPGCLAQMVGPRLIVPADAWTIVVDTRRNLLRCRAVYVSQVRLRFRSDLHGVVPTGCLGFLLRPVLWGRFISTGDPMIDEYAYVQSDQPEAVRRLLSHIPLRDLLTRHRAGTLRVDPNAKMPGLSQVTYCLPMSFLAGEFDPERVRGAIDVVRGTLTGLVAIGAASGHSTSAAEW